MIEHLYRKQVLEFGMLAVVLFCLVQSTSSSLRYGGIPLSHDGGYSPEGYNFYFYALFD